MLMYSRTQHGQVGPLHPWRVTTYILYVGEAGAKFWSCVPLRILSPPLLERRHAAQSIDSARTRAVQEQLSSIARQANVRAVETTRRSGTLGVLWTGTIWRRGETIVKWTLPVLVCGYRLCDECLEFCSRHLDTEIERQRQTASVPDEMFFRCILNIRWQKEISNGEVIIVIGMTWNIVQQITQKLNRFVTIWINEWMNEWMNEWTV